MTTSETCDMCQNTEPSEVRWRAARNPVRGPSRARPTTRSCLADGSVHALDGLARDELLALQWQQEQEFARQILAAPKGSSARSRATCQAYDSATRILARVQGSMDRPLLMGMHPRYGRLVLDLLRRQRRRGQSARFFEIGYGTGTLLKIVAGAGFPIAGIEVASAMRQQAIGQVGPEYASCLHLGEFLQCEAPLADGPWSLVYWNNVFEHIPPDEIGDGSGGFMRCWRPAGSWSPSRRTGIAGRRT